MHISCKISQLIKGVLHLIMKRTVKRKDREGVERFLVEEEIFDVTKDTPFTWKDLKHIQFQDDDTINVRYEEGFYSENNSWDGGFVATVTRYRPETPEEQAERIEVTRKTKERLKRQRYERYLELKKEFENDESYK